MSESQNDDLNTNIMMGDAEDAVAVEPQAELPQSRSQMQLPLLLVAVAGLAFVGNYVWANRADYQAMVGMAPKAACSSSEFGPTCGLKNGEESVSCPLADGEAGCSEAAGLIACTGAEESCCTKMSSALAAAMLEKTNKVDVAVAVASDSDSTDLPPAPPMPEDL